MKQNKIHLRDNRECKYSNEYIDEHGNIAHISNIEYVSVVCNVGVDRRHTTFNKDEVTCTNCLKILNKQRKMKVADRTTKIEAFKAGVFIFGNQGGSCFMRDYTPEGERRLIVVAGWPLVVVLKSGQIIKGVMENIVYAKYEYEDDILILHDSTGRDMEIMITDIDNILSQDEYEEHV